MNDFSGTAKKCELSFADDAVPDLPKSSVLSEENPDIVVLLVDDKALIGKVVSRMLKTEADIEFHYCQSAQEAMRVANEIFPTVILQDLVMPEIDGLAMVQYFRSKTKTRHVPLIVLSAEEDAKVKAKAFALGANDYIVKLPDKIELVARIRYHSQSYINMLQRNAAYEALGESKKKAENEREAAEYAKKKIMDSIRYAGMIQQALLPDPEFVKKHLPDSFILWNPRDLVGGDIFFAEFLPTGFIIAVIDCTGHGIPGAFMTMIASSGIRRIIEGEGCHDPAKILKRLNFIVKTTLQQTSEHASCDDGMDVSVCFVSVPGQGADLKTSAGRQLVFAGAKLNLVCVQNGEAEFIRGDRQSIGYKQSRKYDIDFDFTNHVINIEKGMRFYMYTDGFVDQLGGNKRRTFGTSRFLQMLSENSTTPFEEQEKNFLETFDAYRNKNERQDDMTIIGFRVF